MYIDSLRSLSSAHEKWGQKQKCCVYNFVQCNYVFQLIKICNLIKLITYRHNVFQYLLRKAPKWRLFKIITLIRHD